MRKRQSSARGAVALLLLGGCSNPLDALDPGARQGRAGVALLEADDAVGAEAQFMAGLAQPEVPRTIRARLWHGPSSSAPVRGGDTVIPCGAKLPLNPLAAAGRVEGAA